MIGYAAILDYGGTRYTCETKLNTPTSITFGRDSSGVTKTAPMTFNANDEVNAYITVPITGWSNTPFKRFIRGIYYGFN